MKIAIICYNHFDATISLIKYLHVKDPNIEIDLYFLLSKSALSVEIIDLKHAKIHNGIWSKDEVKGIIDQEVLDYLDNKVAINLFLFNSIKIADLSNYLLVLELQNIIRKQQYNVLHFVGNNPWIVLLNLLFSKTPKIHTLHEPYPFSETNKYRLFRHKLKVWSLINFGGCITVPSIVSHDRFCAHFKIDSDKLHIIPFGTFDIYKEYAKKAVIKEDNVILYYGNISNYKGINVLIDAMKLISASNSKVKLIIAGNGFFEYDVSSFKGEIQVINKYLSSQEIAELNQKATVVVCPYISASQSGVVMTSFAFGNPVVATNVGALPEVIENGVTGIIIEAGNPRILSQVILDLFNNPSKILMLRRNILSKYSGMNQNWTRLATLTHDLYLKQAPESAYSMNL